MGKFEYKKYKVTEKYLGKIIEVNVSECWSNEGIESADVSCSHSTIFRGLWHSIGNYIKSESGVIQGKIVKRLSVDDVYDAIFKEIYFAEKSITESKKEEHDNFYCTRYLTVLVQYENQEIPVNLMLKAGDTKVWIIRLDSLISHVSIDKFRNKVIEEVQRGKRMIDNGCVFSKPGAFSKVKKKIKNHFNY